MYCTEKKWKNTRSRWYYKRLFVFMMHSVCLGEEKEEEK
jgi:hypothetical protein